MMLRIAGALACLCGIFFGGTANAADLPPSLAASSELGPYVVQATLTAGGGADNEFGVRVAAAGDTALVSGTGTVYVFERTPGTDIWQQGAPLTPSGPGTGFGRALAFDGRTAIIGAQGLAYLFRRDGPGVWQEVAVLAPDGEDGDSGSFGFGISVDVHGDNAIVGAPASLTGAAYIFTRRDSQPERWDVTTLLTGAASFGDRVAIHGDTAAVLETSLNVRYSLYVQDGGSGQWELLRRSTFFYARSVALSESTAVVGGTEIYTSAGIYGRNAGGPNAWEQEAVYPSNFATIVGTVTRAAISGDVMALGLGLEGFGVHLLARNQGGQNGWNRIALVRPTIRDPRGPAVATSGDTIAIGAAPDHAVVILVSDIDRDGLRDGIDACPRDPENNIAGGCARSSSSYLLLDDLVRLESVEVASAGQPFVIRATFTNTSSSPISNPFFEVTDLAGGNLLVNADGGPGGVGATLSPDVGDGILSPGESTTVTFTISLESHEPFRFYVSVRGATGQ